MHAKNTRASKPSVGCSATVSDDDRAAVRQVARALEHAIDTLPERSPWRPRFEALHGDVAIGLEPRMWLTAEELEVVGLAPEPPREPGGTIA